MKFSLASCPLPVMLCSIAPASSSSRARAEPPWPLVDSCGGAPAVVDGATATERLTCRVKGFYPFPESEGGGGLARWLFRDTHQAVAVRSMRRSPVACESSSLLMDFMTRGGAAHPVWWSEPVQWHVLLGGGIDGEVRLRASGSAVPAGSKLAAVRDFAAAYDERPLSLYSGNCRVFCARVRREVARLNNADLSRPARQAAEAAADARLALSLLHAGALPALYPAVALALCWEGLWGCGGS
mmetsp:Transcript_35181/g.110536  ORF Transcript_35181/g.110536 Transcript_35181/m.110536 type:complete len:241 (+) Transcript_35181:63-785(+)